jgi:hypothetical protein
MTYERWNGNKFPQNQCRITCNNPYDKEAEAHVHASILQVTHNVFVNMIMPTFIKDASLEDIKAIFKRCCILLFTKFFIYVRLPGAAEIGAPRFAHLGEHRELLKASSKGTLSRFRKGARAMPPSHDQNMAESLATLEKLVHDQEQKEAERHFVQVEQARVKERQEADRLCKVREEELEESTDKHNGLAEATARDPLEVSSQESEADEAPVGDLGRIDEDVEVSLFGENENDAFHIEGLEDGSQFNGNMDTDNEYDEEVIPSAAVVVNEPIPSAVPIPSAAAVGDEPIPSTAPIPSAAAVVNVKLEPGVNAPFKKLKTAIEEIIIDDSD